ncbi:MAG TPA: hypothetical protein VFI84_00425 [Candidatus Saccharimonadales bacterium]|nr:hypothetical protein [Candidatus Saccharimonadales bacterium]
MRQYEALGVIEDLTEMQRNLSRVALHELRDQGKARPFDRVEALRAQNPGTYSVRSSHGPWRHLEFGPRGRVKEVVSGSGIVFYRGHEKMPGIFFLPYGVAGQTNSGIPIFHGVDSSEMFSVCLGPNNFIPASESFHNIPMTPLFNLDKDGAVFAGIAGTPTPAEQELLYGLLDDVENIVSVERTALTQAYEKRRA